MTYMFLPLKRYFDFKGRSRRKEYWLFLLMQLVLLIGPIFLAGLFSGRVRSTDGSSDPILQTFFSLFPLVFALLIIPNLAVTVRRFHDQDKSGWMCLLNFIPLVGGFIVLGLMFVEGTRGPNEYGEDPKNSLDLAETFA